MNAELIVSGIAAIVSAVAIAVAVSANRKANDISNDELDVSKRLKQLEEQRFKWEAEDRARKKSHESIEAFLSMQRGAEKLTANLAVHWAKEAIHIVNNGPHTAWNVSWKILDSDGDPVGMDHSDAFTDEIVPRGDWRYRHPRISGTMDSNIYLSWTDGNGEHRSFPAKLSADNTVTINIDPDG